MVEEGTRDLYLTASQSQSCTHFTVNMEEIPLPGRSVDIELGGQEVITIDLDNLDPNPDDVLDLLKDGQCKVWVWTKLAGEYWRRGYLEAAEKIGRSAVECK